MLDLGFWQIRWYGPLFALGFLISYLILQRVFRIENVKAEALDSFTVYCFAGTLAGARLGHCLFYEPEHYLSRPLEILKVWEGGLASHGAAVGLLVSTWLFSRNVIRQPYFWTLDRLSIVIPFAGACIRLGNLFNSEIYGKPTDVPWAFTFPLDEGILAVPRHPTQLYEMTGYILMGVILNYLYFRAPAVRIKTGFLIGLMMVLIFSFRFFVEFLKEVQVSFEDKLPLDMGQILSIPFVMVGAYLMYRGMRSSHK